MTVMKKRTKQSKKKTAPIPATAVKLTDIIAPSFYYVHNDIKAGLHDYYDLYGGRGSTKSSFVSVEIVSGIMEDPLANAVVFRKYQVTLRESVFEQIMWAINELKVSHLWKMRLNPLSFIYLPTGQKIIFRGLDKAKKTKSIKSAKGYFKFLWFEELDEFNGIEEIRTTQQSVLRGGSKFIIFKTFNPPISSNNWANEYVQVARDDSLRHHSTYKTVPKEWLGQQFINDAEWLKKTDKKAYDHEYGGKAVGLGTEIFKKVVYRTITDEEIERMDRIYQGVDWGWEDPYAFTRWYYDRARRTIYAIDEHVGQYWSNESTAKWIIEHGYGDYRITCDSAEPKSVDNYNEMGLKAVPAKKGKGSVETGMKWLQAQTIVIDARRTPKIYNEFKHYEYKIDQKTGKVIAKYPDEDNHTIDSCRYAFEDTWRRRGNIT